MANNLKKNKIDREDQLKVAPTINNMEKSDININRYLELSDNVVSAINEYLKIVKPTIDKYYDITSQKITDSLEIINNEYKLLKNMEIEPKTSEERIRYYLAYFVSLTRIQNNLANLITIISREDIIKYATLGMSITYINDIWNIVKQAQTVYTNYKNLVDKIDTETVEAFINTIDKKSIKVILNYDESSKLWIKLAKVLADADFDEALKNKVEQMKNKALNVDKSSQVPNFVRYGLIPISNLLSEKDLYDYLGEKPSSYVIIMKPRDVIAQLATYLSTDYMTRNNITSVNPLRGIDDMVIFKNNTIVEAISDKEFSINNKISQNVKKHYIIEQYGDKFRVISSSFDNKYVNFETISLLFNPIPVRPSAYNKITNDIIMSKKSDYTALIGNYGGELKIISPKLRNTIVKDLEIVYKKMYEEKPPKSIDDWKELITGTGNINQKYYISTITKNIADIFFEDGSDDEQMNTFIVKLNDLIMSFNREFLTAISELKLELNAFRDKSAEDLNKYLQLLFADSVNTALETLSKPPAQIDDLSAGFKEFFLKNKSYK